MKRLLLACVLAIAGFCVSCEESTPIVDLIAQIPDARKQPDDAAFDVADVTLDGVTKRSIVARGVTRLTTHATIPRGAHLRTAVAIHPDAWDRPGDGILMFIGVSDGRSFDTRASVTLDPRRDRDRTWQELSISLEEFAGLTVSIVFNTRAGETEQATADHDVAVWGAPVIVAR